MIRVVRNLLVLVVLGLLALPAAAHADPISDCGGDGDLDKKYSNEELQGAIDNIPSDLDEYSNCRQVFKSAISSGSDKRNDGSGPTAGASSGGGGAVAARSAPTSRRPRTRTTASSRRSPATRTTRRPA